MLSTLMCKLLNFFRNKKDTSLLLFSPKNEVELETCGVSATYDLLNKAIVPFDLNDAIKIDTASQAKELIQEKVSSNSDLKNLIIFAHPNDSQSSFLHYCYDLMNYNDIESKWFDSHRKHDVIYAHTCNGSSVLANQKWNDIARMKVSYSERLGFYFYSTKAEKSWTRIVTSIINEVQMYELGDDSLVEKIKSIYLEEMSNINNSFDESAGEQMNLIHLQRHIRSIREG